MSPGFITMQGHKYSHICTTTDTISIPVGEMYLHARMFCALTHMSSIPMGAINFYMQEHFLHSMILLTFSCLWCIYMQECSVHLLHNLLFPWVQCQSLKPVLSQCSQTSFVTVDDFIALYTNLYVFYSHGCSKYLHARTFFSLADTTSIPMLVHLLFPWVQCQNLKPVLSQHYQTGFVAVDDFTALFTPSYVFYSHGCNKFLHAGTFFTLTDTIMPIFTINRSLVPC